MEHEGRDPTNVLVHLFVSEFMKHEGRGSTDDFVHLLVSTSTGGSHRENRIEVALYPLELCRTPWERPYVVVFLVLEDATHVGALSPDRPGVISLSGYMQEVAKQLHILRQRLQRFRQQRQMQTRGAFEEEEEGDAWPGLGGVRLR
eukprot:1160747-Pelagomonas_calceolata.AAC.4